MSIIQGLKDDVGKYDLNEEYQFLDSDTLAHKTEVDKDGNPIKFRLKGINSPEVAKYFGIDEIEEGTAGSNRVNSILQSLAKKKGFTNVVRTGEYDYYDRELIDLRDNEGRSWETELLRTGVLDPTRYSSKEANRAYQIAKALGTDGLGEDWDKARNAVATAIHEETLYEDQFKRQAIDEVQLAYGGELFAPGSVQFRSKDRTLYNKALGPFSTGLDIGLTGAIEGLYGAMEMTGESWGWDWAKNVGEAGIYRARKELQRKPEIVASYKDIDGFFGREGFLQYVANNAAISLPYMAATIAGAAAWPFAGPSVVGIAATGLAAAPATMYAGIVWNEMEGDNKNAWLAVATGVAQAALDRAGLKFLTGNSLLSKEGRDKAIAALARKNNIEPEEAKALLLKYSRLETAKLVEDAAKFAKDQLKMRNVARSNLKRLATGMGGEGLTEALQETIGYTAAHAANNYRDWDANEFNDRLIDASIAGTSLGMAFATPGSIYDYGAWVDVAYRSGPNNNQQVSKAGQWALEDIEKFGSQRNIQAENLKVKRLAERYPDRMGNLEDVNDKAERELARIRSRDSAQIGRELWRGIPRLYRGLTRSAFWKTVDGDIQADSLHARAVADKYNANLQRILSGENYENRKHHQVSKLKWKFGDVTKLLAGFGRTDKRKSRQAFSKDFYEAFQNAYSKAQARNAANPEINWETDLEGKFRDDPEQFASFMHLISKLDEMANSMHDMQSPHNSQLGKIKYYLSRHRSMDKIAIENDKSGFKTALLSRWQEGDRRPRGARVGDYKINGMTPEKADQLIEAILNQDGVTDINDLTGDGFSITSRATFKPQSHRRRESNLSDRKEFDKFLEKDLFTNISNAAKSAVRYSVLEEFVGSDNKKLNYDLNKIQAELIRSGKWTEDQAKARVDKLAYDLKNYFDAESGNYKRLKSPVLQWAQKNLLFVTTITGLPLATISNFVELALFNKGLTWKQIFGTPGNTDGSINGISRSFVDELSNTINRMYGWVTNTPMPHERTGPGHMKAQELGLFDWEVGAAHTTGVSETGRWHQRILDMYFKGILLQQWTNAARASRAAIAGDYITDKLAIMAAAQQHGVIELGTEYNRQATYTNEVAEAEESLRNLGLDTRFMMQYHMGFPDANGQTRFPTDEEKAKYERYMNDATFNFINEAVAMPQSSNRPLIYQDPRFALFTQFQGFIATFTANHLPKMYEEMIKRGTPAMKYNVFATMATMIALGFVSQHLKDLLKYGKTTPYFEGMDYFRRGVAASGLMGTGERVLDFAFPMYEERYKTNIGWAFGTIAGESAALTKAFRFGELGADVYEGDRPFTEAVEKASPLTQAIAQQMKNVPVWDFGENKWQ